MAGGGSRARQTETRVARAARGRGSALMWEGGREGGWVRARERERVEPRRRRRTSCDALN